MTVVDRSRAGSHRAELALLKPVLPRLFEGRSPLDAIRAWIPQCGKGEEAFAVAMLLADQSLTLRSGPRLQLFATDRDPNALAHARRGHFQDSITRWASAERLHRWFTSEGQDWIVTKRLREICIFSSHDPACDPPFPRIDLVCCRKRVTDEDERLRDRLPALFAYALRPGGFLFLGPDGDRLPHEELFSPVDAAAGLYVRTGRPSPIPDQLIHPQTRAGASVHPRPEEDIEETADARVRRLERDLSIARDHLDAMSFELGTANQELKTASEEHEAIIDELAASKAELQSLNDQLEGTNAELARRIFELGRANSDLLNLFDSTRIATLFLDPDLRLRSFTPACEAVFSLTATDVGRPIGHFNPRLDYQGFEDDAREVLKTLGQVERQVTSRLDERRFLVRILPYRSLTGEVAGVVATFLDITRAVLLEDALTVSQRRLALAQHLGGVGVWEWRPADDETWWSPLVYRLWGLAEAERPPAVAELPIHPEDRAAYEAAMETARRTGELRAEWRVLERDGGERWLAASGRLNANEDTARVLGVVHDVTERKRGETRLRLLLAELQHRVRNILGVVRSVVSRTIRNASSLDQAAEHLEGRLETLARTQSVLAGAGEAAVDLEQMVREEMLSVAAREEQLEIEGPPVRLRRDAAETFALTLHELATNALKYGALSRRDGRISVRWRVYGGPDATTLRLDWVEGGVPAIDIAPRRSGFGRELIERALPFELGARTALQFRRGGAHAFIELPLTDTVAVLAEVPDEG